MPKIRVASAVADQKQVVLYLEDGSTKVVNQGDHRLQALLDVIIPITMRGEIAEVDLTDYSVYADFEKETNGIVRFFRVARSKLGSLVGNKDGKPVNIINVEFTDDITAPQLSNLMNEVESHIMPFVNKLESQGTTTQAPPVINQTIGFSDDAYLKARLGQYIFIENHGTLRDGWYEVRDVHEKGVGGDPEMQTRLQVQGPGLKQWVKNACVKAVADEPPKNVAPATMAPTRAVIVAADMDVGEGKNTKRETVVTRLEPMGKAENVDKDETVVAVIDGMIIPDVEKLKPLIMHSLKTNSVNSVRNFLKRAAEIIKDRSHSVADLMRFLERGDLPLAEDGSIIAYKILRKRKDDKGNAYYVDCHTGLVPQKVGSYVCVDASLVDPSRSNECSNGLHIARRGYLGSFSGDVCTLCKIDPEDVMVVPHGDPNKVRVKGYHILSELSKEAFQVLQRNQPMTGEQSAMSFVISAIKGEHVGRLEEVRIHGQRGTNVVVTPLLDQQAATEEPEAVRELSAEEQLQAKAVDDPELGLNVAKDAAPVKPLDINKRVNTEIEKGVTPLGKNVTGKKSSDNKPAAKSASQSADKSLKNNGKSESKDNGKSNGKSGDKVADKGSAPTGSKIDAIKSELPPEQFEALSLVWSGVTQSESSRRSGVSRRTIGRLTDKYGSKAPT